jgi:hypothetical protein
MQPVHRRRRKRPRDDNKNQKATAASGASSSRRAMPNLEDDADLAFLDNNGDKPQKPFVQTCLPILLAERQRGIWNRRQCSWQSRVLLCIDDDDDSKRRKWRPFASRSIPFTLLGTPASAAVLALERNASYVLSLGGKQGNDDSSDTTLALRFYGKSNDNLFTRTVPVRDGNPWFA